MTKSAHKTKIRRAKQWQGWQLRNKLKERILYVAAGLFIERRFTETSLRLLAQEADTTLNTITRTFGCKENILCKLVSYVLEAQFTTAAEKLKGVTDDPILFYAAETTMQLYMAESCEAVRELYLVSYSMQNTMDIIQQTITEKLEQIFHEHLPHLTTKDFYELEIASGGIMRSFMARRCDMYFTMDRTVSRFLETTFCVFQVPDEKIHEAIEFVQQFDFPHGVGGIIAHMMEQLKDSTLA